jgi:hypothetical protein
VQVQDGRIVADQPIRQRIVAREWLALPENAVATGPLDL